MTEKKIWDISLSSRDCVNFVFIFFYLIIMYIFQS